MKTSLVKISGIHDSPIFLSVNENGKTARMYSKTFNAELGPEIELSEARKTISENVGIHPDKFLELRASLLNTHIANGSDSDILVITVPHGLCPVSPIPRRCDLAALKAAKCLQRKFQTKYKVDVALFVPDHLREECDQNRDNPCAVFSRFRDTIQTFVDDPHIRPRIKFAIDIHSFPEESNFGGHELVVLDDRLGGESYSKEFVREVKRKSGLDIVLLQGAHNALHSMFRREHSLKSFLLEFSEDFSDNRMEEACEVTSSTLSTLFFAK